LVNGNDVLQLAVVVAVQAVCNLLVVVVVLQALLVGGLWRVVAVVSKLLVERC
jgi:hypothetical protein